GLLFGALAYLLFLIRGALPIFFAAGLLAYAMEPILKMLERRGYSRRSAVAYVFFVFLLLFVLLVTLLATAWQQVQVLAEQARQYQQRFTEIGKVAQERLQEARLPTTVKQAVMEGVRDCEARAPQLVATRIQTAVSWTLSSIGLLMLVLIVLPII